MNIIKEKYMYMKTKKKIMPIACMFSFQLGHNHSFKLDNY